MNNSDVLVGDGLEKDAFVVVGYRQNRSIPSEQLKIGDKAHLRTGTVIYLGSAIGMGLETGHNVVIREQNSIGDNVCIWSNSIIDYGCKIGSRVRIHSSVYIAQGTVIEDDVFLAPGVIIANEKYPGQPWCTNWDPVVIKKGAQIGANVTLLPGVTIGERALIGSGSVVSRDIPDGMCAYGNPARCNGTVNELAPVTDISIQPL